MKADLFLKIILLCMVGLSHSFCAAAQSGGNPVVFGDVFIGGAFGRAGGLAGGLALSSQIEKHFLSLRFTGTVKFKVEPLNLFVPIPYFKFRSSNAELALLYGRRFVQERSAVSISGGVSHNWFSEPTVENGMYTDHYYRYFGFPFDAQINFFQANKRRYRIMGLIPVGPRTGFGRGFGFRVFGNISRFSYFGVGICAGLGFYKKYD